MKITAKKRKFGFFQSVLAEEQTVVTGNGTVETEPNTTTTVEPVVTQTAPQPQVNVNDLIAKARADEKAKLYPQIESLKADKANALNLLTEKDKEISKLTADLEATKSSLTTTKQEAEEGTKANKTVQELTLSLSKVKQDLDVLQVKYDTDINAVRIEGIREKEIAKANGQIIPELVLGNTEEEILASVQASKQRYQAIQEQAISNIQMPSVNPATNAMSKVFAEKSIEEISSMTPQQYAEYRTQLNLK